MSETYLDAAPEGAQTADRPARLPARDWLRAAMRAGAAVGEGNLTLVAAGCAFYALLALPPSFAALAALYGYVSDPADIAAHLDVLRDVAPPAAYEIIAQQAEALRDAGRSTLGLASLGALALAVFSARAGVRALITGVGLAYREEDRRSFLMNLAVTYALTAALVVLAALTLSAVAGVPAVLAAVPLAPTAELFGQIVRWPIAAAALTAGLALLYRFGPARRGAQLRWLTPGSVAALALWLAASGAFSIYLAEFGAYNETYGTLGAVAALLMWFWLSALAALFGAALNAELELATSADTTVGAARPMGRRRAFAADHVAARAEGAEA
ncbi:MAG: YihY/virulence factor BrkB family protein [Pseudomonadota bacterium]